MPGIELKGNQVDSVTRVGWCDSVKGQTTPCLSDLRE